MLAIKGIYKDGKTILEEKIKTTKPLKVIVTFLEGIDIPPSNKMDLNGFSFKKSRKLLKTER